MRQSITALLRLKEGTEALTGLDALDGVGEYGSDGNDLDLRTHVALGRDRIGDE